MFTLNKSHFNLESILELRDRIGDPIMIGRFLDFSPIISDARFLSVRSEIGIFFCVCALFMTNTSKFLQINSTKVNRTNAYKILIDWRQSILKIRELTPKS